MRWLLLVSMAALVACNRSVDAQLTGGWKQIAPHGDSFIEEMMANPMPRVEIDLKPDHTFKLSIPSFRLQTTPMTSSLFTRKVVEGSWKVQGQSAVFDAKTSDGKSIAVIRAEQATARSAAELAEHDRMLQEAIQRQLATQGQAGVSQGSPNGADMPNVPGYARDPDQLVVPATAELSKNGRKLVIHFDGDPETVDLDQEE